MESTRVVAELNIPDEAQIRAERAVAPYALSGPDTVTAVEVALEAAAPLIVAAELQRLADALQAEENSHVIWRAISRRARELRGEV